MAIGFSETGLQKMKDAIDAWRAEAYDGIIIYAAPAVLQNAVKGTNIESKIATGCTKIRQAIDAESLRIKNAYKNELDQQLSRYKGNDANMNFGVGTLGQAGGNGGGGAS